MKDFFDGLIQHIKNDPIELLYSTIVFLLGIFVLFLLLYVFLFLRRWYYTSRIRRTGQDFIKVNEYVKAKGKPINHIQRFLLAQFGEIVEISSVITCVIGMLLGTCIVVVFNHLQMSSFVENTVIIIWLLLCFPVAIHNTIKAIRELIKHARFISFAIWCAILAIYIFELVWIINNDLFN